MEGSKTDFFVDCRKGIFGSEINSVSLSGEIITFIGPFFIMPITQKKVCKLLQIPATKIYGVELIQKNIKTTNWFEKLLNKKDDWIRIYYLEE